MKWIKILQGKELKNEDFVVRVKAGGRSYCVIRYNKRYFATAPTCPHAGGDLSKGWCNDGKLICPYHRYSYCLETGRGAPGQGDYIDTFPIELRSDGLYIGITERWPFFKKLFRL